ncbi:hypothetical protein [Methylomonas sp. AM2-LC]|uniref:hypothetical protein n=1 Tax=Methylomonas sp. AM2-LC TaxID=3153301 RepID=UPI003264456C
MKKYIIIIMLLTLSQTVKALPSFTRQTGEACTACHTQAFGPNLNPYGREFKLHGYTAGSGESLLSRFSGMAEGSISNLKRDDNPSPPGLGNNNLVLDQASVFFGGRIIDKLGLLYKLLITALRIDFILIIPIFV